jgi:hypothetical protein
MPEASLTRHRLDLWALLDVYRATFEVLHEAGLQLPFAVVEAWLQLVRR